jgi:hypothetical protein
MAEALKCYKGDSYTTKNLPNRFKKVKALLGQVDYKDLQKINDETWAKFVARHPKDSVTQEVPVIMRLDADVAYIVTEICDDNHNGDIENFEFFYNTKAIVALHVTSNLLADQEVLTQGGSSDDVLSTLDKVVTVLASTTFNPITQEAFSQKELTFFFKTYKTASKTKTTTEKVVAAGDKSGFAAMGVLFLNNAFGVPFLSDAITHFGNASFAVSGLAYLSKTDFKKLQSKNIASSLWKGNITVTTTEFMAKIQQTVHVLTAPDTAYKDKFSKIFKIWQIMDAAPHIADLAVTMQYLTAVFTYVNSIMAFYPNFVVPMATIQSILLILMHPQASYLTNGLVQGLVSTLFGTILPMFSAKWERQEAITERNEIFQKNFATQQAIKEKILMRTFLSVLEQHGNIPSMGSITKASKLFRHEYSRLFLGFVDAKIMNRFNSKSARIRLRKTDDWAMFLMFTVLNRDDHGEIKVKSLNFQDEYCLQHCKNGEPCINHTNSTLTMCGTHSLEIMD